MSLREAVDLIGYTIGNTLARRGRRSELGAGSLLTTTRLVSSISPRDAQLAPIVTSRTFQPTMTTTRAPVPTTRDALPPPPTPIIPPPAPTPPPPQPVDPNATRTTQQPTTTTTPTTTQDPMPINTFDTSVNQRLPQAGPVATVQTAVPPPVQSPPIFVPPYQTAPPPTTPQPLPQPQAPVPMQPQPPSWRRGFALGLVAALALAGGYALHAFTRR